MASEEFSATDDSWRAWLFADLLIVAALVVLTNLFVFNTVLRSTPIRSVLAFPMLLFVPGYAFIAALYPERYEPSNGDLESALPRLGGSGIRESLSDGNGISGLERFILSVGLSIAIVPLTAISLTFTPYGIRLVPILTVISTLTLVLAAVATIRRWALPVDERFSVHFRPFLTRLRVSVISPETRTDLALNVLVVVAVLVAASTVTYAVVFPQPGQGFSEFYLLSRTGTGQLTATSFPTNLTEGQPTQLVVGVGNHEYRPENYTVVGEFQRVAIAGNRTTVTDQTEVARFAVTLADNETALQNVTVTPTTTGRRLRLAFMLYRGDPPATPSMDTAYRSTYLWVNVTAGVDGGSGST